MGKPIAMRCNQEQFDAIEPILKEAGIDAQFVYDGFVTYPWLLTNYLEDSKIVGNERKPIGRKKYRTWNEQIFLEACGIKTEKQMKITKENIIKLDKKETTVRELFPEVFAIDYSEFIGKWIKWESALFFIESIDKSGKDKEDNILKSYGFNLDRQWSSSRNRSVDILSKNCFATESEVFEALKSECLRRYKKGDYIKCFYTNEPCFLDFGNVGLNNDVAYLGTGLWMNGENETNTMVFQEGKWATIIETISREEAEKLLNKKIV